jgi:hypothetical protein
VLASTCIKAGLFFSVLKEIIENCSNIIGKSITATEKGNSFYSMDEITPMNQVQLSNYLTDFDWGEQ